MMKKRIVSLFIVLALIFSMGISAFADTSAYDNVLVFVHVNDVHASSEVEPYVKAVADDMKATYGAENVIVVNAGDMWGGQPRSVLSSGTYIAEVMKTVGYDAATLGKDDTVIAPSVDALKNLVKLGGFPILCANLVDSNGDAVLEDYIVLERSGVKVGVFGITTETMLAPKGTTCSDLKKASEKSIAALKAQGCDVIVALTHIGYGDTYSFGSKQMADSCEGIDLIIDGHSHTALDKGYVGAKGSLVAQAGQNGENIGVTKLYLKDGKIVDKATGYMSAEDYKAKYTADATVAAALAGVDEKVNKITSAVVAHTDVDLIGDRNVIRTSLTNLGAVIGDFLCDFYDADAAIFPAAWVRASIPAGDITLKQLLTTFGSGVETHMVTVDGAKLRETLNFAIAKYPNAFPAFAQFSGFTFTMNEGSKYTVADIYRADGTKILDTDKVKLVIGPPYTDNISYGITDSDPSLTDTTTFVKAFAEFISKKGYTIPTVADKITILKAPMSFADVKESDWFYAEVKTAYDAGLIKGVGANTFAPKAEITRESIWMILARIAGENPATLDDARQWAVKAGISDGANPKAAVTREQLATMIYRYEQSKGGGFKGSWVFLLDYADAANISSFADEGMHWCVMNKIINGSNNMLNPQGTASRAEATAMLLRYTQLSN